MSHRSKRNKRRSSIQGRMIQAKGANPPSNLKLTADITFDVEAAADGEKAKLPTFKMLAYSGGVMAAGGFGMPLVVDLAGMKPAKTQIPIRLDHDRSAGVGHASKVEVQNGKLVAEGFISRDTEAAREVVASSKNGFPWQASIGASIEALEEVPKGQSVNVNGRNFKGPLLIARKTTLGEISVVDVGADTKTSTRIAAKGGEGDAGGDTGSDGGGEQHGETPPSSPAPAQVHAANAIDIDARVDARVGRVLAERGIGDIAVEIAARRPEVAEDIKELAATALEAGWDEDKFKLHAGRLERTFAGVGGPRRQGGQIQGDVIEAAMCMSGGMCDKALQAQFSEKALEAANSQYRHQIGLTETLMLFAQANGFSGHHSDILGMLRASMDIQAAGFSTMSLPGILSNVANKFLLSGFEAVEHTWREIAAIRSVKDFKEVTSYSLTGGMVYEKVGPTGELQHGDVGELSYKNKAETYGRMFAITRQDIINDDLGALTRVPFRIGRGGQLKINLEFWTAFLANAAFFTTVNKNFAAGASTALGLDALTQANLLFLNQEDPDGNPVAINPAILLVPNALEVDAKNNMESIDVRDTNANKKSMVSNPHKGAYRVVKSSYLANAKIAGNSAKAWYLLAEPGDMPTIEMAFLNGQQNPTVESADADFNTLGIQMRGWHDFGVALQEFRGGVKMKGEA